MSFHGNHWTLDPKVTFLNHESFGACPQAVLAAQQEYRSRLVLIDHVTSQTALVFPVGRIVSELHSLGVSVLVDGAHAPGMLSLDLEGIGAGPATTSGSPLYCETSTGIDLEGISCRTNT